MRTLLETVGPTLRSQHSLITRAQALERGLSRSQVDRLLRSGVWEAVDRTVYGPYGVAWTWHRRLMAAVLGAPDGARASHRSAAALYGVGGIAVPPIELSIPRGTRFRRSGVVVHESRDLDLALPTVIGGIPCTDLRRLAVDLGAVVSFPRFKHTIREIRHGHGVTSEALLGTYLAHKRQGRNGCGALRDWLDRYFDVQGVSESGIELVALDALLDAGLPAPVRQYHVDTPAGRFRLDLAYVDLQICIEIDGRQHEDADIKPNDARRTRALKALGWTILRVRSDHFATDLAEVVRALRRVMP